MSDKAYPELSPFRTGLACKCPRCGKGKLFSGFLDVGKKCASCGLDYSGVDSGDGPAVFVIFVIGFLVVGLAFWFEMTFQPPYWLHLVIWMPLIPLGSIGLLRPFKATLIALQYKHKATQDVQFEK